MTHALAQAGRGGALVMGRALHGPWNEGGRVIGRNLARGAGLFRPVRALSLTNELFRPALAGRDDVDHVFTRLPYGALGDYAGAGPLLRRAGQLLAADRFAVAHLVGLPLALAPWLRGRGLSVVAHATLAGHAYLGRVEQARAQAGWRAFDRWVDAYACSSELVRARLAGMGCPPHKLHVVPPAVDVQRFRRVDRQAARQAHGIPADAFVALYVGSVSPLRFPAREVLRALLLAAQEVPGLRLHVVAPVGTLPANRAWAEENVRRAAAGSSVPVSLELRDLTDEEKAELYSAADVVLLPFAAPVAVEPPLTMLEAMACEATVAASPYANRSQVVGAWSNGVTFRTAEELASRIRRLHGMGARRQAVFGSAARDTVVGQFSIASSGQALASLWAAAGVTE